MLSENRWIRWRVFSTQVDPPLSYFRRNVSIWQAQIEKSTQCSSIFKRRCASISFSLKFVFSKKINSKGAPQFHLLSSKLVHFQKRGEPQFHIFSLKIVNFQKKSASQVHLFSSKNYRFSEWENFDCWRKIKLINHVWKKCVKERRIPQLKMEHLNFQIVDFTDRILRKKLSKQKIVLWTQTPDCRTDKGDFYTHTHLKPQCFAKQYGDL